MSFDYYYPVNITNKRVVYCKELKNKHIITLQKYLETTDNEIICDSFESLIKDIVKENYNLNYIDKFLILLSLRKNSLGKTLDLKVGNSKNSVSITEIENKILENYTNINFKIEYDIFKIKLGAPIKLNYYDSFYFNINEIEMDNNKVIMNNLSDIEFEEYLDCLPFDLLKIIKDKTKKIKYKLFSLFTVMKDDEKINYHFSFKHEEIFNLLKLVFSDNLKNILYNQYVCASKLYIPPNNFNEMSPGETKLILKHYINELEKQKESRSGGIPPGLGNKPS